MVILIHFKTATGACTGFRMKETCSLVMNVCSESDMLELGGDEEHWETIVQGCTGGVGGQGGHVGGGGHEGVPGGHVGSGHGGHVGTGGIGGAGAIGGHGGVGGCAMGFMELPNKCGSDTTCM